MQLLNTSYIQESSLISSLCFQWTHDFLTFYFNTKLKKLAQSDSLEQKLLPHFIMSLCCVFIATLPALWTELLLLLLSIPLLISPISQPGKQGREMGWRSPASSTREIAGDALKALTTKCRGEKGLVAAVLLQTYWSIKVLSSCLWCAERTSCLVTTLTYPVHVQPTGWKESESNWLVSLWPWESDKPWISLVMPLVAFWN